MTVRHTAALLCVAVFAAACNSQQQEGRAASSPSASPTASASAEALAQPGERCGFPDTEARVMWFDAPDGTRLDGAIVGTGASGVVLAHQYPASLCGWWPFASYLASKGFRVLLFDFRCFGESSCPDGDARGDYLSDMAGAAATLRADGASHVALMGASLGANVAMISGSTITPKVSAVVSLSGEADLTGLLGNDRLDALSAVPRLTSPLLQIVAREDNVAPVADIRALDSAAGSKVKKLVILDASYAHGWDIVSNAAGDPTDIAPTVVNFLRAHD
jgi:pimeloyl-ACP methyl ester carboxylesterase